MNNNINQDNFYVKTKHINTLFQFIKNNKEEQFIEYLSNLDKETVDINIKDEHGNYLLFFAIMMNNKRILKKIIEYGARLDILDSEGYTIMYYPIKFNYLDIIDVLIEYNKKIIGISLINLRDIRGYIPIFYAIKYKNMYALQELLINGANVNYKNDVEMNALHLVILKKDITMTKMLLKYIKNINAKTSKGSTALHYACSFQLIEITKLLLDAGADPEISEAEYDLYPIFYAVIQNNIELTKLMINYNVNPNDQDYLGNTIIHYSIMNNHNEIIDYIFDKYEIKIKNEDTYMEDINNKTNKHDIFIDTNITNIDGLTITNLFLYKYIPIYNKYLQKILPYVNLNYQDNIGNTPLHIIAETNLWENFDKLLDVKKMNIFIKNNIGKTVLDLVNPEYREKFLDIASTSYYNYLQKHEKKWLLKWQNKCSKYEQDKERLSKYCLEHIRNDIIKEKISVPIKKNKKNITIINYETIHFSTFTGSLLDVVCGFKYLLKKYSNTITTFHTNQGNDTELEKYYQTLGIKENYNQHIIHFEIRWIFQRIFFPPSFESIIKNIINRAHYKYIIIPIGIILSNGNHSNSLLYDIENNVIERFEPHGSGYPTNFNYNPVLLDEILHKKFTYILSDIYEKNIKIKYYRPMDYLPKIGFQTIEVSEMHINKNIGDPNGFCTLWTIWYLDYRLKYITKNPGKMVEKIINKIKVNNYSFRTIIRNYSKKITDLRDMYLSKIDRNINDYINNKFSVVETKKLLIEILTDDTIIPIS